MLLNWLFSNFHDFAIFRQIFPNFPRILFSFFQGFLARVGVFPARVALVSQYRWIPGFLLLLDWGFFLLKFFWFFVYSFWHLIRRCWSLNSLDLVLKCLILYGRCASFACACYAAVAAFSLLREFLMSLLLCFYLGKFEYVVFFKNFFLNFFSKYGIFEFFYRIFFWRMMENLLDSFLEV